MSRKTSHIIQGVNAQDYYDGLIIFRDSLNAQIKALGETFSICTHSATELLDHNSQGENVRGETIEKPYHIFCKGCGKMIDSNIDTVQFGD